MNNKQKIIKINIIITIFFSTTLLLINQNSVMGFTETDPEYIIIPNANPYANMIANGCLATELTLENGAILDSKGLLELGLPTIITDYAADLCMGQAVDVLSTSIGWSITEIKTNPLDTNDQIITLKYNGIR